MTTACISIECVCSGAEKPGGNFWMPPYGPLTGSPQRTTPLTSGGAPGVSAHFISPAGMKTAFSPAGFGAVFPFFAAAACACRTAQETKTPMTATIVLRIMDVSFPNEGRERQSQAPRSNTHISEPAAERVASLRDRILRRNSGRTLPPLDPALFRGQDSPASGASTPGASTAATPASPASAGSPADGVSGSENSRRHRPTGRRARPAEGAAPACPRPGGSKGRRGRAGGDAAQRRGCDRFASVRVKPAVGLLAQPEGDDVGVPPIVQPRGPGRELSFEELARRRQQLPPGDLLRAVASPGDVEEIIRDADPDQQKAHEKKQRRLSTAPDSPIGEIEKQDRRPEKGQGIELEPGKAPLKEPGRHQSGARDDPVQNEQPDGRVRGVHRFRQDEQPEHSRSGQQKKGRGKPARLGRTVLKVGMPFEPAFESLLRSEERRVGKECRYRCFPYDQK